ncbi:MAG TPA: histidine kinase dimerization/phospho-acceptor domain-containing protein [Kofleriaceae bacterium]|nr:histidine kinase dimerization/phospho-acceptor domain-containing protein [Kofleriaceae bacterium]
MTRARTSETAIARPSEHAARTPEPQTSEVLSAVSHDLRNPLGTITLGTTLLLNQYGHEARARRPLEMIQRAAARMQDLMERLTDLAGIQVGHLDLDLEDVHANELIGCGLEGKSVTAEHAIDDVIVRCDKRRVCHVLHMALGDTLRDSGEPVRIHVTRQASGQALFVISENASWRTVEHYLSHGIIAAHGGELWLEGASLFFTLPEA